jgi:hypothetical protein
LADVGLGQRTQDRIGYRMEQRIAIGVADGAAVVLDAQSPEHERSTRARRGDGFKAMKVVAVPDPRTDHGS